MLSSLHPTLLLLNTTMTTIATNATTNITIGSSTALSNYLSTINTRTGLTRTASPSLATTLKTFVSMISTEFILGQTTSTKYTSNFNENTTSNNTTTSDEDGNSYLHLTDTQKTIYYIALSLIFVLGTTGNLIVIYLISRKSGQRTTNFDIHIVSLAVADLLASIFLPLVSIHDIATGMIHWYLLGDFGCKLFTPMPHINSLVSAVMLAAISIERLLIIKRKKLTPRSPRKTIMIVLLLWLACILVVSPYIYVLRVIQGACFDDWNAHSKFTYYAFIQSLSCFIPMIIMVVVYTLSAREMKQKKVPGENDRLHTRRRKRIQSMTQMFGVIVVIFFLMTTPYMVSSFVVAYYGTFNRQKYAENRDLLVNLQYATYTLMAFNACIDPLIYSVRYNDLRNGFKNTMSTITRRRRKFGVGNVEEAFLIRRKKGVFRKGSSKESMESII